MKIQIVAATVLLMPWTGSAFAAADPETIERAAALFDSYAPIEADVPLDQLIGETGFGSDPDPALIEQLAPEVIRRAEADNQNVVDDFDDFGEAVEPAAGAGSAAAGKAETGDSPSAASVAVPAEPGPVAEPVIPDGWVKYEKFGLSFAAPPEFKVKRESESSFMAIDKDEMKPPACAIQLHLDDKDYKVESLPAEAGAVRSADRDVGFGIRFSGMRLSRKEGGVSMEGAALFSEQPIREEDGLVFVLSCGDVAAEKVAALVDQVFATVRLAEAPTVVAPKPEELPLNGLVSGKLPKGWTTYRSNASEWIVIAPSMQAAVNFHTGFKAKSALDDLAPSRRNAQFAADPVIEHRTLIGTNGWLFSGEIAPDDPEHGVYNGGMHGPNAYFVADRCTDQGEALVVSMSAQQSWIDKGNSLDAFLDTAETHWPDAVTACSADVAEAIAKALGQKAELAKPAEDKVPGDMVPGDKAPEAAPGSDDKAGIPVVDAGGEWINCTTPLHGTTVSYPADLFIERKEVEKDDKLQFSTKDGEAEFGIFGTPVGKDAVIDDLMKEVLKSPDIDRYTSVNRLDDTTLRVDGLHKGQNVIQIMHIENGILHFFGCRYSDRYADVMNKLAGTVHVVDPAAVTAPTTPKVAPKGGSSAEVLFWDTIKESTDPADFEAYLDQFPDGEFVALAHNRLKRLAPVGHKGRNSTSKADPAASGDVLAGAAPNYGATHHWQTYLNDRYGTRVDYPDDLFQPLPPPVNNDGRRFQASDGRAGFYVFSEYNVLEQSLRALYDKDRARDGEKVTYATINKDWFVISGTRDADSFYRKTILEPDGLIRVFEVFYRRELQHALGGVVTRMSGSFGGNVSNAGGITAGMPPSDPPNASPAKAYTTPARGTAERRAIMNAARGPIVDDIGQNVIFVVRVLRTDGRWAYLQATPVQPNGQPLDWTRTRYAADWNADMMSDTVMVLLNFDNDVWRVIDHIVGPTDVYWQGWIEQHHLPEALFHE